MPYWDRNWGRYLKVTVQASKVAATHTNFTFPIILDGISDEFYNNVKSDGSDIRILLANDTTQLPRDVVVCNTTTKKCQINMLKGSLSDTIDTVLHIYIDNPSASEPAPSSTYGAYKAYNSTKIKGAWSHEEDPSGGTDAIIERTENQMHGTSAGGMVSGDLVTGILQKALQFSDGANDYYGMGNTSSSNALKPAAFPISVSMMVNFDSFSGESRLFMNDSWSVNYYGISCNSPGSAGKLGLAWGDGGSPGPGSRRTFSGNTVLSTGTWYHLVFVIPATSPETNMKIYINGVADTGSYSGSGGAIAYSSTYDTTIGGDNLDLFRTHGKIDCVKFWTHEITADEASTLNEAERNNSTFRVVGDFFYPTDRNESFIID